MQNKLILSYTPIIVTGLVFLFGQVIIYLLRWPVGMQVAYGALFVLAVFAGSRKSFYIFVVRIVTPISVGLLSILLYEYAYSFEIAYQFLDSSAHSMDHIENFFSFVSVLYAVTTAFLLWKGLTDHDHLKHALNDEASQVRSILYYTAYFAQKTEINSGEVAEIKRSLSRYIANILDRGSVRSNDDNDRIISEIIAIVANIDIEDENDKIALEEIMKELSDLSTIRARRQNFLDSKISPYLLLALITMSVSIVYPFFTMPPQDSDPTPYTMIFVLSTLLSFMYITMIDISSPFAGFWKIKTDSLKGIRQQLKDELSALDAPTAYG